jgi:hypothetical protein
MIVLPERRVSVRIAGFEASFRSAIAAGQLTPAPERCFPGTAVMQREVKTVHCNRNPIGTAGKTL